jgi:hypothetical protein
MSTKTAISNSINETGVIMDITPETASQWLERNTHNRKLNQSTTDRFIKDMTDGRWQLTHQGIAFDSGGTLIDGQHRLWAVVLSGVTVRMRVFFNMPTDSMLCIDTGRMRSNLDVIKLSKSHESVRGSHLAILRAMLRKGHRHIVASSVDTELELLNRHREAIDFVIKNLYCCNARNIRTAILGAIVARAYYCSNHEKLARFCEVMRTGIANGKNEMAAAMLNRFLISNAGSGVDHATKYGKIERALLAFLNDETITRLYCLEGELFLLPEEQAKLC